MNLPSHATLRSSAVKARQPAVVTGPVMEVELDLGARAPPRQAVQGPATASDPNVVVRGAVGRSPAAEGLLDSFFLHARVLGAAGRAAEPCVLAPGCRLGAEVAEALHEPSRV